MKIAHFPFAIFLFSIVLIFGGVLLFLFHFPTTASDTLVSPLGVVHLVPSPVNGLLENILRKKTIDTSIPHEYFPDNYEILDASPIDITAAAYIALDRDSKRILVGKNISTRLPIASTTKILTAIVALENAPLNLSLSVSSQAAMIGEATMGLSSGERVTLEEALYGALLPSGNDAAETLAEGVGKLKLNTPQTDIDGGGARLWFIQRMNKKVQDIGLYDSYFFNPSGLDGDTFSSTNFSTVLDLAILTNYALTNKKFSEIVGTSEKIISYKEDFHKAFYLYNILNLDASYKGIRGVKPGISIFAKETLVSYLEKDGRRIIVVILGSDHTKDDVIAIYKKILTPSTGVEE